MALLGSGGRCRLRRNAGALPGATPARPPRSGTTQVSGRRAGFQGLAAMRSAGRSEEHTSKLQSLMRISYAVFCLKKKRTQYIKEQTHNEDHNITNKYTA